MRDTLKELYIRFMVWLGAAPPEGHEHLLPEADRPRTYTLQEGESLFSVARKFKIPHNLLAKANAVEEPTRVKPGHTLAIPPAGWDPASGPIKKLSLPEPTAPAPPVEKEEIVPAPPVEKEEVIPAPPVEKEEVVPAPPVEEEEVVPAPPVVEEKEVIPVPPVEEEEIVPAPPVEEEKEIVPTPPPPVEKEKEEVVPVPPAEEEEVTVVEEEQLEVVEEEPPTVAEPTELVEAPPKEVVPEPVKEVTPVPAEKPFLYKVQRGDTLSSIARKHQVTVQTLVEANDIPDASRIFPGQKLIIPDYVPTPPVPKPEPKPPIPLEEDQFFVHTVSSGDTLKSIAKRYDIDPEQLIEINDLDESPRLRSGQRLIIPDMILPPKEKPTPVIPVPTPKPEPPLKPVPTPDYEIDPDFPPIGPLTAIRALYVSYFAIGHTKFRQHILKLLDTTEFNAIVIDAKGDHGWISYPTSVSMAHEIGAARATAKDFDEIMTHLKDLDIYTIARLVTFKDNPLANTYPELAVKAQGGQAVWQDRDGLSWSDPFMPEVWDYNIQLAIEAAQLGFNEIQFDYLRFPTASKMGNPAFSQEATKESRVTAITGFLSTVRGQLEPFDQVKVAANTFGYTCWRKDDTLIGQDIERLGQYLDVLSPKLHPSTFGNGIPGYKNAVAHPYEVVYESARRAVERVTPLGCTVRPWIQDFPDYRFDKRSYGKEEIRAQIKGCFDAKCTGFMVWDPRIQYTDDAYAPVAVRESA